IINKENKALDFNKIYLEKKEISINIIKNFIEKYKVDIVVIGNGTASNETYEFIKENFNLPLSIVNESGASVYSASEIANEEFPNLDLTDRGTISIGRRFIDPLAEFLKIPVISIGVGMYQHDMNQKELETKLSYVIEDVVNLVGINVNTASIYLLKEISGLNLKSAKKIYNNKPYKNREELKKILSSKAYEQAIGFLRVVNSKEELDNTSIHPEQYEVSKFIIKNQIKSYPKYEKELKSIYPLINEKVYEDIILAYNDMGKDPRKFEAILNIEKTLNIEDLKIGDIINGVVRNILQFGVFVDIGIKNDGLIHISELANKFIKDPHEIVEIGQSLKVKVIGIDLEKGKVKLSLKF
ncbi:S1 RNA-binding domain-containing protein, partial [bacterium]|nr:S1 RNA-binding domain-containing protein [bacterium]